MRHNYFQVAFPLAAGVSLCYHKTVGLEVVADETQAKGETDLISSHRGPWTARGFGS